MQLLREYAYGLVLAAVLVVPYAIYGVALLFMILFSYKHTEGKA